MATLVEQTVAVFLAVLVSVCAGEICTKSYSYGYTYTQYCVYGCCGSDNDCCSGPVGLIVGLCVGGAVFLFFIILTICLCRRRRYAGVVYGNGAQPAAVIVQQNTTTQNGAVTTAGVQPGVTYPPYPQYQYQYPPGAYPGTTTYATGAAYPPPGQVGAGYPPQPMPYAAEPPKYESLNVNPGGGITNQGYDHRN